MTTGATRGPDHTGTGDLRQIDRRAVAHDTRNEEEAPNGGASEKQTLFCPMRASRDHGFFSF